LSGRHLKKCNGHCIDYKTRQEGLSKKRWIHIH
jgi:hypothetical protein